MKCYWCLKPLTRGVCTQIGCGNDQPKTARDVFGNRFEPEVPSASASDNTYSNKLNSVPLSADAVRRAIDDLETDFARRWRRSLSSDF